MNNNLDNCLTGQTTTTSGPYFVISGFTFTMSDFNHSSGHTTSDTSSDQLPNQLHQPFYANDLRYISFGPDRENSPSPKNTNVIKNPRSLRSQSQSHSPSSSTTSLAAPKPVRDRSTATNLFNTSAPPNKQLNQNNFKSNTSSPISLNHKINYSAPAGTLNYSSRSISPLNTGDQSIEERLQDNIIRKNNEQFLLDGYKAISTNTDEETEIPILSQPSKALVLELDLACNIKFISKGWKTIVGTNISKIVNKPMRNIIVGDENDKNVFETATSIMSLDDETYRIRFITQTNLIKSTESFGSTKSTETSPSLHIPSSPNLDNNSNFDDGLFDNENETLNLKTSNDNSDNDSISVHSDSSTITTDGNFIELEAQGIMIHDKNHIPTHSMWIVKPWVPIKDAALELPEKLILTIGIFGTNLLDAYMLYLADLEVTEENDLPLPSLELCRICEEKVPNWWLEKHSELCLVEHKVEDMVYIKQEELQDHKKLLQDILESLHRRVPQSQLSNTSVNMASGSSSGSSNASSTVSSPNLSIVSSDSSNSTNSSSSFTSITEYKGYPIPLGPQINNNNSSYANNNQQLIFQRRKSSGTLLPQIRFPFKNIENLIAYCDEALSINPGEIRQDKSNIDNNNDNNNDNNSNSTNYNNININISATTTTTNNNNNNNNGQVEIIYSPNSTLALKTLSELNLPTSSDPAIKILTEDTKLLVEEKLETLERYAHILQYVDKITKETNYLVLTTVNKAIQKIKERIFCASEPESENDSSSIRSGHSRSIQIHTPNPKTPKSGNNIMFHHSFLDSYSPSTSKDDLRICQMGSGNSTPSNSTFIPRRSTPIITIGNEDQSKLRKSSISNIISTPRRPTSPSYSVPLTSIQRTSSTKKPIDSNINSPFASPYLHTVEPSNKLLNPSSSSSSSAFLTERPPLSPLLVPMSVKHTVPSIKDYEIIKPISKGAFGSVFLAKRKVTGDYFAIKVLKKSDMIAKNQVTNVKAERAIMMAQSDSPHVVQLIASFQTTNYLYLVMEYLNGGDLSTLLHNMGTLPDIWAKRYIAEVIVDVDDLHSKGIVHRDLKPDNLLIDHSGHIKLTDFGLSRMGLVNRQMLISKYHSQSQWQSHSRSRTSSGNQGSFSSNKSVSGLGFGSLGGSFLITPGTSKPGSLSGPPDNSNEMMSPTGEIIEPLSLNNFKSPLDTELSPPIHQNLKDYFSTVTTTTPSPIDSRFDLNNNSNVNYKSSISSTPPNIQQEYRTRARTLSSASKMSISSQASDGTPTLTMPNNSNPNNQLDSATLETPKNYALFDPSHSTQSKKFVGTPDYLAPETVAGQGQDTTSDWWSIGCILFEFLFGFPPFNDDTPDKVFHNILYNDIQWPNLPPEKFKSYCSDSAKDLIEKLLIKDPNRRLGNGGSEEIMDHEYFNDIDWDELFHEDASFVPETEDPESTDYFDSRGANMNTFPMDEEIEDLNLSIGKNMKDEKGDVNDIGYTGDFEKDEEEDEEEEEEEDDEEEEEDEEDEEDEEEENSIGRSSRFYSQSIDIGKGKPRSYSSSSSTLDSPRQSFSKNHPPSTQMISSRERTSSRLNDPGSSSEFGSFQFRNLMILEKQNKDAINRLKSEHLEHRNSISSITSGESIVNSNNMSGFNLPSSTGCPSGSTPGTPNSTSRNKGNNNNNSVKSPILSFIQPIRKNSANSILEPSKVNSNLLKKSFGKTYHSDNSGSNSNLPVSSLSDNEDKNLRLINASRPSRHRERLLSSNSITHNHNLLPTLTVLLFEPIPIHRYSISLDLKKLGCIVFSCSSGSDLIKLSNGNIKFDLIFVSTEYQNQKLNSIDLIKLIRFTNSINSNAVIISLSSYSKDLMNFDFINYSIEYPITRSKLREILKSVEKNIGINSEEAIVTDTE